MVEIDFLNVGIQCKPTLNHIFVSYLNIFKEIFKTEWNLNFILEAKSGEATWVICGHMSGRHRHIDFLFFEHFHCIDFAARDLIGTDKKQNRSLVNKILGLQDISDSILLNFFLHCGCRYFSCRNCWKNADISSFVSFCFEMIDRSIPSNNLAWGWGLCV